MVGVSLAIIEVEENQIVMVARKNNDSDFGLVGGKIDEGETAYQAMVREVFEETGLRVKSAFKIDERMYQGNFTNCYYVTELDIPKTTTIQNIINQFNQENQQEGFVKIGYISEVMSDKASYSDYNLIINELRKEYLNNHSIVKAFKSETLLEFMDNIFPINWGGVKARIIETGVAFTNDNDPWLIGVSDIQKTLRKGSTYISTLTKSSLFIAHDCFHNLWGLPFISDFTNSDFEYFKRAQMSGEVAVLCITEFILAKQIKKRHPELATTIDNRNATLMMNYGETFYHLSPRDLVMRLDEVLHKGIYKDWVLESEAGMEFFADYIPMLQRDRKNINDNWEIMKANNFIPNAMPNVRYSRQLSGSELTQWMIDDFMHIRTSDETVDYELSNFNRARRKRMIIPTNWVF